MKQHTNLQQLKDIDDVVSNGISPYTRLYQYFNRNIPPESKNYEEERDFLWRQVYEHIQICQHSFEHLRKKEEYHHSSSLAVYGPMNGVNVECVHCGVQWEIDLDDHEKVTTSLYWPKSPEDFNVEFDIFTEPVKNFVAAIIKEKGYTQNE